ncbi:3-dehydroquinate synthase [Rubripirellula obstinata]|uniref:3-dehydroquinate synthase n=1 Tax=Rubripirellula obstinata TaxID=406547 RepID=UPI0008359C11|nr:3-dehydroquinate synthase [Rubripirellula obstinata]
MGDRSYPIHISSGQTDTLGRSIRDAIPGISHAVVVMDESVVDPWGDQLCQSLVNGHSANDQAVRVSRIEIPSGESSKSIEQFDRLMQWMLRENSDRASVLIAVGGGVVGDLAGYAAASFTRGIRFVQVPTTLLAMVDSSVGGKTGINLPGAKNMVGAFWQPSLVLVDTDVLSTLDEKIFLSGLGEVVKYGVIEDAEFFAWLETNADALIARDPDALRHAIETSCQCKANVVGEDERESTGRRAILNYGHTFAHAIEATAGYGTLLHGEAVSIGMQMAARLALSLGMFDEASLVRQTELLRKCQLPIDYADADPAKMLPVMMKDKKVAHGKLKFVLPSRIGCVELVDGIDDDLVVAAIGQSTASR